MPTATNHGPDELNDERLGRIPPETERGLDEKPPEPPTRPLGPSRAAMTARLKRIRDKLRQQRGNTRGQP